MAKFVSQYTEEPGRDIYFASWLVVDTGVYEASEPTQNEVENWVQSVYNRDEIDRCSITTIELRLQKAAPSGWVIEFASYIFCEG